MRQLLLATAIIASLGATLASAGGCFSSENATGFVLPSVTDVPPGHGMCPVGFYCPNSFPNDTATVPRICPATAECLTKRIVEQKYCDAQGLYEPIVCPEGYYCPTGYSKIECPKGYRCPFGSTEPRKCGGLSYCPSGSRTEMFVGVLLVIALVDAVFLAIASVLRRRADATSAIDENVAALTPEKASETVARLVRKGLGDAAPVSVSFQNLSVTLPDNHPTAPGKSLLQGVSGNIRAGEVTAIMGPSGAGKTVFFTSLLGKQPPQWRMGGVLRVCGDRKFQDFAPVVGFVPQDNVLRMEATVNENIKYASDIRLPAEWTDAERLELRSAVLRALSLDRIRDVKIGGEGQRGVPAATKKLTSCAGELASAPAAIFLDEPTTGLDATTSLELVRLLKVVAREAKIPVAMVVHQPRVEIFEELDTLLLLAPGGRTVYSGTREGAQAYLSQVNPEANWSVGNPCDIAMDLIADRGSELADMWAHQTEGSTPLLVPTEPPLRVIAGPLKQFAMAHAQGVLSQIRSPLLLLLDVFLGMLGGIMLTTAAIDSPLSGTLVGPYAALSPRSNINETAMLFMLWGIALAAALGPAGVRVISRNRANYWRETAAGHSRLAFFLGASSAELYRVFITIIHFSAVVYLMWRPNMDFGSLFGYLFMFGLCMDGQSLMLGTIVEPSIAPLLSVVIGVFSSLLNGFSQIPILFYIAYPFGVTELAYASEMSNVRHVFRDGILKDMWEYELERPAYDFGVIVLGFVGLRLAAFLFLALRHRDKQR